jgi:hypothetical protein
MIASYQDLPSIGDKVPKHIYNACIETVNDNTDREDLFYLLCYDAEEMNREYSPFEFTAQALNETQESKSYDVWLVFDDGIAAGIKKNYKERIKALKSK